MLKLIFNAIVSDLAKIKFFGFTAHQLEKPPVRILAQTSFSLLFLSFKFLYFLHI